jgi:hypothetical protein
MMKAGDLIFVTGHSLIASAINFFDPGRFSHVAVALSDTHIIESQYLTNVQTAEMQYTNYVIVRLDITDEQRDKLVHEAIELVGKKYGYWDIIGLMLNERGWNHPNELICTEVAITLLKKIDFLPKVDEFAIMKPNHFYQFVTVDLPKTKVI